MAEKKSQFNSPTISSSSKSNITSPQNLNINNNDINNNVIDVDKIIKNYLFQRGYTFGFSKAENNTKSLKELEEQLLTLNEHDFDTVPNQFSFFKNESEENYIIALNYSNGQYEESFKNLKVWTDTLSEELKVKIKIKYINIYLFVLNAIIEMFN